MLQNQMEVACLGNTYLITVMDPGAKEKNYSKEVEDLLEAMRVKRALSRRPQPQSTPPRTQPWMPPSPLRPVEGTKTRDVLVYSTTYNSEFTQCFISPLTGPTPVT